MHPPLSLFPTPSSLLSTTLPTSVTAPPHNPPPRPTTSFLVPLDRCVALARQGLQPGSLPPSLLLGASGLDKYYRGQVRGEGGPVPAFCKQHF